jgi:hypothetical protein
MASKADKADKPTDKPQVKSIAIAGAGGIGGFVAAGLFDYGGLRYQFPYTAMKVDIYDDDRVDATNMLHQNYTEDDIGQQKAVLCANRYQMTAVPRFMTTEDFKGYDVVFSCVDSMTFRKDLYQYGWEHPELFWIDGRCSSRQIGVYHAKLSRKSIEGDLTDSKARTGCLLAVDKANKVSHATPQIVANMMVQTFLNYLRGEVQSEKIVLMI